jgi:hypothetical protein
MSSKLEPAVRVTEYGAYDVVSSTLSVEPPMFTPRSFPASVVFATKLAVYVIPEVNTACLTRAIPDDTTSNLQLILPAYTFPGSASALMVLEPSTLSSQSANTSAPPAPASSNPPFVTNSVPGKLGVPSLVPVESYSVASGASLQFHE